ncbi:MAG: hypothetical protein EPO55_25265 [Reyranella sp.]|uniref:hypothetical protein n=1 Tax=Reyranella sp. TaxID=1929291 RepID=UPI0011F7152C|nr:hypothetical protein [Reyranella sp.]TAJ35483.1 MAG: hypothetical protein EPO55_25265 [Reyranella sp.]
MATRFLSSTIAFAALLCLGAVAHAQLKDENLLVAMPAGFKVGYQGSANGILMQEWIPPNETVEAWSEMVTVQVFLNRKDLDPVQFLATMEKQWAGACKGSNATPAMTGQANGYPSATMLLRCPLLAASGKPETTMLKAIKGNDSFYLVQRAVRSLPTPAQLERTKQYLDGVSVCDTRRPANPCKM